MLKHLLTASLYFSSLCFWSCCTAARAEATLTAREIHWLRAAGPVLAYSQRLALPVDIIVQPQAGPGDVPMAMGFDGKRCKLVLSLRGNEQSDAVFNGLGEAERGYAVEAMAAHEIGHCWRYVHGAWHALPAGFVGAKAGKAGIASPSAQATALRDARREEGYADLVALAWTARRHPAHYVKVARWLRSVRATQPVARGAHDTRAWVGLAREPGAFDAGGTPFDAAAALWRKGLLIGE